MFPQELRGPTGGVDAEADLREPHRDREDRGLVLVPHGHVDRPLRRQGVPRRDHRLVVRAAEGPIDPHHLARALHLGAEDRVDAGEPLEREHGGLHGDVVDARLAHEAHAAQGLTEHHLRRDLREGHADGLRDVGNRSTRARIRLEDVHGIVLHRELKVHQADDLQRVADLPRDSADLTEDGFGEGLGRQYTRGVAGMDARFLDVLLDPADEDVLAIRDDVHVNLRRVGKIAVHEDRVRLRDADRPLHESGEILFAVDDLHPAATEDVRRPDENGVADPGGHLSDLVEAVPGSRVRLPDSKALHERRELSTVLGEVDRGRWRAEDPSPRTTAGQRAGERDREIDRGLTAELHDDTIRLLLLDDVQDVLEQERFEVQPGGDVEIGRDGLGIVVRDDRGDALFPQCEDSLDTAVIELDALADPDGTAPDDQHLPTRELLRLTARLVRGIEVGRLGLELPSARVDHLVRDSRSTAPHGLLRAVGQGGERLIGEPEPLCLREDRLADPGSSESRLDSHEMSDLLDEERVPLRQGSDLLRR